VFRERGEPWSDRFHEEDEVTVTDQLIDEHGLTDCERRAEVVLDETDEDGVRDAEAWVRARRHDARRTAIDIVTRVTADRGLADELADELAEDIVAALTDAALLGRPGARARLRAPLVGMRAPALLEVAETIA
jgi:hypothetical protein